MARLIRTEVAGTVAPHGLRDALATRLFVCLVQSERTYYWKHMVLEPLGSVAGLEEQPVGCGRREVIRVGRAIVMQRDHVEGGVEYGRRYCLGLRKCVAMAEVAHAGRCCRIEFFRHRWWRRRWWRRQRGWRWRRTVPAELWLLALNTPTLLAVPAGTPFSARNGGGWSPHTHEPVALHADAVFGALINVTDR